MPRAAVLPKLLEAIGAVSHSPCGECGLRADTMALNTSGGLWVNIMQVNTESSTVELVELSTAAAEAPGKEPT